MEFYGVFILSQYFEILLCTGNFFMLAKWDLLCCLFNNFIQLTHRYLFLWTLSKNSSQSHMWRSEVRHNQRCLERAKETELTMPLHNLARIVTARLPDWIILNLCGIPFPCQDRYVNNDSSFIDFALLILNFYICSWLVALSFSPFMNI